MASREVRSGKWKRKTVMEERAKRMNRAKCGRVSGELIGETETGSGIGGESVESTAGREETGSGVGGAPTAGLEETGSGVGGVPTAGREETGSGVGGAPTAGREETGSGVGGAPTAGGEETGSGVGGALTAGREEMGSGVGGVPTAGREETGSGVGWASTAGREETGSGVGGASTAGREETGSGVGGASTAGHGETESVFQGLSDIEVDSASSTDEESFDDEKAQQCFDDWVVSLQSHDRKMLAVALTQSFISRQKFKKTDAVMEAASFIGCNKKTVRIHHKEFFTNKGNFFETKQGKYTRECLLNNEDLRLEAAMWVRENAYKKGAANMTASSFCQWVNETLLLQHDLPANLPR